jgi:1-acyl-sn-glycerol-3-phosphate acyltransferase
MKVMRHASAVWKLLRVLLHVLAGLLTILLRFPRLNAAQQQQCVVAWSQGLLACLAIKLEVKGAAFSASPALLMANHVSWMDIPVVHAVHYCRFVGKSDLKHWPVLGTLIAGGGTLFIERENRRDALRMVHTMADSLRSGDVVAVFPEGTTSDGTGLLPFHANLTQAAISAHVPVQPLAMRFVDAATGEPSTAPAYVGDTTLLQSVWRTLTAPPLAVVVTVGEPQTADGRDRRSWTAALRTEVERLRTTL